MLADEKEALFKRFTSAFSEHKKLKEKYAEIKERLNEILLQKENFMEIYKSIALINEDEKTNMNNTQFENLQKLKNHQNVNNNNMNEIIPSSESTLESPLFFQEDTDMLAILSLGMLSSHENSNFYNNVYIYPIGYRIIRTLRYKYDQSVDLVTCEIGIHNKKIQFKIIKDDKVWIGGLEVWSEFLSFNDINEYFSIEEFLGLNIDCVQKLIEKLGDVRLFRGYIPVEYR
ncbi:hypothetical protein DMUE_1350 [Dictyocoela muelleri]|nr:hypothetical protein DMUE_1350 [Dictyocoela muelleri]